MTPEPIHRSYPEFHPAAGQRGFALVVTLSLIILLTAIAVGLLTLSSTSLRSSTRTSAQQQAKANARLALVLALGELQDELGPDRRISAPGGQQLAEGDKSGGNHWTGVYDSWPADEEDRPSPTFRRWLISGDESGVTNPTAPAESASAARKVALVSGDADHDAVKAGLIEMPKEPVRGGWATKALRAKLGGAIKPAVDEELAAARMQSALRAAHEVFLGDSLAAADPLLDRLISVESADLVGEPDQPIFHDATTNSLGLLTNVRGGGFRPGSQFPAGNSQACGQLARGRPALHGGVHA